MDDKETKNIDGIKTPGQQDAESEPIQVTVNEQENQPTASTDVSINGDGDMATEPTEEAQSAEPEAVQEEPASQPPTLPQQAEVPSDPPKEDPGIVPSVQPMATVVANTPETELVRLKEKNKSLKVWLVVLMLLLVGVASALVVYFAQQSKAKNDLKTQQQQNSSLQQQLTQQQQNSTQKTIDNLNSQLAAEQQKSADLQKTIDEQNKTISSYQTAVKQLLTACGDACNTINVPTSSTNSNTTN